MADKKKILIVDDDWDTLHLLQYQLSRHGYAVALASDSVECRKQIQEEKPDLVIMDIMLGPEDGTRLYDHLVDEGLNRSTPVIFLTNLAEDQDVSPAKPGRKYALLSKGIGIEGLVNQIDCLVHHGSHAS